MMFSSVVFSRFLIAESSLSYASSDADFDVLLFCSSKLGRSDLY